MTRQIFIILLTLALLLSGCSAAGVGRTLDAAEDRVEEKLDAVEDTVENALRAATAPETAPPTQTAAPTQAAEETVLTPEEAEKIALDHAGFSGDQVERLRTEFEIDDGVPQYDVQFYKDRQEYEFEIHAQTGKILSYDRDRDD